MSLLNKLYNVYHLIIDAKRKTPIIMENPSRNSSEKDKRDDEGVDEVFEMSDHRIDRRKYHCTKES